MMRFLIVLEQTESGFSVQVPGLAIVTHGENIEGAKLAAIEAVNVNLNAYQKAGKEVPESKPVLTHLENPDFADLLFYNKKDCNTMKYYYSKWGDFL